MSLPVVPLALSDEDRAELERLPRSGDRLEERAGIVLACAEGRENKAVAAELRTSSGLSESTVGRIWRKLDIKPHLIDSFKLSTDPLFVEKAADVAGLYHDPPDKAVALCVGEKSQVQAHEVGIRQWIEHCNENPRAVRLGQDSRRNPQLSGRIFVEDFRPITLDI